MATENVVEMTLEERVHLLERQNVGLTDFLREAVIGYVTPTLHDLQWDPAYDWNDRGPGAYVHPDDLANPYPPGTWVAEWTDGTVNHW